MPKRPQRTPPQKIPVPAEDVFGHIFQSPELLTRALTHRSLSSESAPQTLEDPTADNEQLEFVGDAVLGMIVAEALFRLFPSSREGELTRLRASLVSRISLAEAAARIGLGAMLRLGRGEERTGGRHKPAILADAFEAIVAALYLDAGLDASRQFIHRQLMEPALPALHAALLPGTAFSGAVGDHKSALQELLQATGRGQPLYVLTAQTGPDHNKSFHVEVRVADPLPDDPERTSLLAEASGPTKKQAQQAGARLALAHLASKVSEP